jgi:hypothetical protein
MPTDGPAIFLRGTEPQAPGLSAAERLQRCVQNTGNLFFESALLRQIEGVAVAATRDELPGRVGRLVLSMANFISPATDLGYLVDELETRRIDQVVMIGAGAQAYGYDERIALTAGTSRFLRYVADRSETIGVRGDYTADALARLGIRNVEVIGCPSLFWTAAPPLLRAESLPATPRLAIHGTPLGYYRDRISALLALGMRHGADWIMQSEAWMLPLLEGEPAPADLLDHLGYYAFPDCAAPALETWLRARLRVFFDPDGWIAGMRRYDFVFGSRFHGNVAAILAGIPALNLPFDTRTRELCEYHNLPVLPLVELTAATPLETLHEAADFSLFLRSFPHKRQAYADFLERNGLSHRLAPTGPRTRPLPPATLASRARLERDLAALGASGAESLSALARRDWHDRDRFSREAADLGLLHGIADRPPLSADALAAD